MSSTRQPAVHQYNQGVRRVLEDLGRDLLPFGAKVYLNNNLARILVLGL